MVETSGKNIENKKTGLRPVLKFPLIKSFR